MPAPRPRHIPPQPLTELARGLSLLPSAQFADVSVTGITHDSQAVQPGDLFAALPGERHHGARFAAAAISAGAVAVLTDEDGLALAHAEVPVLVVESPRAALGALSARIFGEPSRAMTLVGITGTNGKTTTSYLLDAAFAAGGHTTALFGTVETRIAGERLAQARTTPEAPELQALLAVAREAGVDAATMEVSSHALALGRVAGCRFAAAVFTNLSQDHLDFHGDMDSYFAAKASLFRPGLVGTAVIGVDDSWGERLLERVRLPNVSFSVDGVPWADWQISAVVPDARGTSLRAHGPAGEDVEMRVPLPGNFNVANALGALAAAVSCGVAPAAAARGIASLPGVPGRLEPVDAGQGFVALVDYAHTPDAVATLLATLRPVTPGRLVIALGCGGDRDRAKRSRMARAAATGSDLAVFTSDNPRSEDPMAILAEMTDGLELPYAVEPGRAAAIALAISGLDSGDTVVIAGKGHESGQERDGKITPFDDREVLRSAIEQQLRP